MAELIDLYKIIPKRFNPHNELTYPSFQECQIKLPCRAMFIGPTSSGKTRSALAFIQKINAWTDYHLFVKKPTEPLYKFFSYVIWKIDPNSLHLSNRLEDLPSVEEFDENKKHCVIIDDMVLESPEAMNKLGKICIYGRKNNISLFLLSQDYTKFPTTIREQMSMFCVKKHSTLQKLKYFFRNIWSNTPFDEKQCLDVYRQITKNPLNVMTIDVENIDPRLIVRQNFASVFDIPELNKIIDNNKNTDKDDE